MNNVELKIEQVSDFNYCKSILISNPKILQSLKQYIQIFDNYDFEDKNKILCETLKVFIMEVCTSLDIKIYEPIFDLPLELNIAGFYNRDSKKVHLCKILTEPVDEIRLILHEIRHAYQGQILENKDSLLGIATKYSFENYNEYPMQLDTLEDVRQQKMYYDNFVEQDAEDFAYSIFLELVKSLDIAQEKINELTYKVLLIQDTEHKRISNLPNYVKHLERTEKLYLSTFSKILKSISTNNFDTEELQNKIWFRYVDYLHDDIYCRLYYDSFYKQAQLEQYDIDSFVSKNFFNTNFFANFLAHQQIYSPNYTYFSNNSDVFGFNNNTFLFRLNILHNYLLSYCNEYKQYHNKLDISNLRRFIKDDLPNIILDKLQAKEDINEILDYPDFYDGNQHLYKSIVECVSEQIKSSTTEIIVSYKYDNDNISFLQNSDLIINLGLEHLVKINFVDDSNNVIKQIDFEVLQRKIEDFYIKKCTKCFSCFIDGNLTQENFDEFLMLKSTVEATNSNSIKKIFDISFRKILETKTDNIQNYILNNFCTTPPFFAEMLSFEASMSKLDSSTLNYLYNIHEKLNNYKFYTQKENPNYILKLYHFTTYDLPKLAINAIKHNVDIYSIINTFEKIPLLQQSVVNNILAEINKLQEPLCVTHFIKDNNISYINSNDVFIKEHHIEDKIIERFIDESTNAIVCSMPYNPNNYIPNIEESSDTTNK